MFTPQRKECCSQCPYSRSTDKEYLDTRGDNSERFVGQGMINAILPCHMESPDNNATVGEGQQCAGAAKYRANCGHDALHPRIGKLDPDHDTAFSSPAELIAHHKGISVDEATCLMEEDGGPWRYAFKEIHRAEQCGKLTFFPKGCGS